MPDANPLAAVGKIIVAADMRTAAPVLVRLIMFTQGQINCSARKPEGLLGVDLRLQLRIGQNSLIQHRAR